MSSTTTSPVPSPPPTIPLRTLDPLDRVPRVPKAPRRRPLWMWLGVGWIVLVVLLAVFAKLLPLPDPGLQVVSSPLMRGPGFDSMAMWLGTNNLGQSMMSRIVYGAQVSLVVSVAACAVAVVVGTLVGMTAGYFGGWVDSVVGLLTDTMFAFPGMILLLTLATVFNPSAGTLIAGMGIMGIPPFLRLARAHTLTWSQREFVRAAKVLNASTGRILMKEVLPNVLPALGAFVPIVMSHIIVAEGAISFLGYGVQPPTPSWGGMISAGTQYLEDAPQLVLIPAAVIFLTVLSFNQLGDHLQTRNGGGRR
ncbi:MAG: ABC transporter permease [Microbacterium sp.]|uniref:ABC transporter permease n=1 Tax=Microbacterium sp. TaxID=51671 RepID=UPI0039E3DEAA